MTGVSLSLGKENTRSKMSETTISAISEQNSELDVDAFRCAELALEGLTRVAEAGGITRERVDAEHEAIVLNIRGGR